MTDKTDLIREIHEYVTTHGGENTATHLLVQAASAIQTQAAELEAVGAGGVSGPLMGQPQAMPDVSALTERGAKAWAGVDAQALRDGTYQQAAPKAAPVVWLSSKQLRGVTALHGQYLPFRCQPEGRFDTPVYLVEAAPKAAPGDVLDEALRERDDAEDFIDALLDEVLGHERPEWSSSYGRADALNDVQERMTALHKPAVDKAWGRFQSAMAAPQQEAQEPSRAAKTWCSYVAGMIGCYLNEPDESTKVQAIAGIIERRLWALPTPQPAPDCHHRPPCNECAALAAKERQP